MRHEPLGGGREFNDLVSEEVGFDGGDTDPIDAFDGVDAFEPPLRTTRLIWCGESQETGFGQVAKGSCTVAIRSY